MVTSVFHQGLLQELLEPVRTYIKPLDGVRHIFTAIDPACGGARSKWAAVTAVYPSSGDMVVSVLLLFFFSPSTGGYSVVLSYLFSYASLVCSIIFSSSITQFM